MNRSQAFLLLAACLIAWPTTSTAQFRSLETEDLRLIYFDLASDYMSKQLARSFHNSMAVYKDMFSYEPSEKVTVYLHDTGDYGNAGADVIPTNWIMMAMAPLSNVYETAPANERLNSVMHHELIHVSSNDGATGADRFFRGLFQGKVSVEDSDPVTILYSYLTAPRRYAPRWYQEGIAVFMETWMSGGYGRTKGGYDEMVFRTRVLEDQRFYDMVGLEAEGTSADFQVGVNSYLYGTRFMSYLSIQYGPEKVIEWMGRQPGSRAHFTAQFNKVFELSITRAWREWITFEKEFQKANLGQVRKNPVTQYREIAVRPLGSMSRPFIDPATNALVVGVNYPGKLSHIASVDLINAEEKRITGVNGPTLFIVSYTAFDPDNRRLFFTTNNSRRRNLESVDLSTGDRSMLMKESRIGDLAFNRNDGSLWGVRHDLGFSSIVRIPSPYDDFDTFYIFDYGKDIYDIDISPDGRWLTGALVSIDGTQKLVRTPTDRTPTSADDFELIFDFGNFNPEGFVFSPDGKYLYGTSYLSGVSNIFRYDFEKEEMQGALTNGETGYFRPLPTGGDSLLAFRFTSNGFQPVMIKDETVVVKAIEFLGQKLENEHPVVKDWIAPPPSVVDLDSLGFTDEPYIGFSEIRSESIYPIIHGYKDDIAVGLRLNLSDPLGMHRITASATVLPDSELPDEERFHASLDYRHLGWSLAGSYNRSDFYDLFGPSKQSRRGYAVSGSYSGTISYDGPKKNLGYDIGVAGYFNLQKLPSFQNIDASFTEMGQAHASIAYKNLRSSLGAVDNETGYIGSITVSSNYVNNTFYPRASASFDFGLLLPVPHLSLWIRSSAGASAGKVSNPFANYYFGGFRNNWVDKREEKQYHNPMAFPGMDIDELGGTNYARIQAELILPPLRFRHAGGPMLFLKWLRLSVFSTGLATNLDRPEVRRRAYDFGAQLDLRIMLFSYLRSTLSVGYARAKEIDGAMSGETMVSLKIL